MRSKSSATIRQLTDDDLPLMRDMLAMFGEAFGQADIYGDQQPSLDYLRRLLAKSTFIALAAINDDRVVGGIAAYELEKFEQERSEIYIYDLAVDAAHRREGIATMMPEEMKAIAARRGAFVIFVQAEHGDEPAIRLYSKLGTREDVLHFDIEPYRE